MNLEQYLATAWTQQEKNALVGLERWVGNGFGPVDDRPWAADYEEAE